MGWKKNNQSMYFDFTDSPAKEIDGFGQPSYGQEGTQSQSLNLEPLNKLSLDRQWNWLITSAFHVFQICTMCRRLTVTFFGFFMASQK